MNLLIYCAFYLFIYFILWHFTFFKDSLKALYIYIYILYIYFFSFLEYQIFTMNFKLTFNNI